MACHHSTPGKQPTLKRLQAKNLWPALGVGVDTEVARAVKRRNQIEKVEDIQAIMGYGVMSTPGVVIDDHGSDCSGVVHAQASVKARIGHSWPGLWPQAAIESPF